MLWYHEVMVKEKNLTLTEKIRVLPFCPWSLHMSSIFFFFLNWYWFIFMWFWKGSDSVPKTQDGAVLQRAEKEILHYRWKLHFFLLVNNLMWDKLLGLKLASARSRAPLGPLKDSAWPSAVWHISHPIKMLTEILKLDKNSKNQSSDD